MRDIPALLQPLKDRLAAATPGPWFAHQQYIDMGVPDAQHSISDSPARYGGKFIADVGLHSDVKHANSDLIVNAPTDQAKLIAAIEGASGPVDALMAQLVAREERWKAAWESGELTHDEAVSATQEDRWAYGELAAIRFALTQALGGDTA